MMILINKYRLESKKRNKSMIMLNTLMISIHIMLEKSLNDEVSQTMKENDLIMFWFKLLK